MIGTNCGNCRFFNGASVKLVRLNKQGGFHAQNSDARHADLLTLPGIEKPKRGRMCTNVYVNQPVTDRMCCNFWDNPDAIREFDK